MSTINDDETADALIILGGFLLTDEPPKKRRSVWVKPWLQRKEKSVTENLLRELALEDHESYRRWIRMDTNSFYFLLDGITERIQKMSTLKRPSIPASDRLALTLRFLATGESYQSLSFQFRISKSLISRMVPEVCSAIYEFLQPVYLQVPKSSNEWLEISQRFNELWHFPHCLGALDGKHVVIQPFANSGSFYYNYKGFHSVVLLALVDADYKFIFVNAGTNGRVSDGGIWSRCELRHLFENNLANLPPAEPLTYNTTSVPYVIVADSAFALKPYLMRPFSGNSQDTRKRIFQYRLSRARRVVENAFGILGHRFQLYRSPIRLEKPESVETVILATVALHNFLRSQPSSRSLYMPPGAVDHEDVASGTIVSGHWRTTAAAGIQNLPSIGSNVSIEAKAVRDTFADWFMGDGAVSWQSNMYA